MQIKAYDNGENMLADLRQSIAVADSKVQEWQKEIKAGDYFLQFYKNGGSVLTIYGEVLNSEDYLEEGEIDTTPPNYLFCKCYSKLVTQGELGDVHISQIDRVIPEEDFKEYVSQLRKYGRVFLYPMAK